MTRQRVSTHRRSRGATIVWTTFACALLALAADLAPAAADEAKAAMREGSPPLAIPNANAERGRHLFVMKGCVICHSVNGVGGKAAPALDAPPDNAVIDLLDFAARMWRGAFAMQELQSIEFGYRVELTGEEIGDLAAFAGDAAAQVEFSKDEIPDLLKDWLIDEPYWEQGEWPETEDWRFPE